MKPPLVFPPQEVGVVKAQARRCPACGNRAWIAPSVGLCFQCQIRRHKDPEGFAAEQDSDARLVEPRISGTRRGRMRAGPV